MTGYWATVAIVAIAMIATVAYLVARVGRDDEIDSDSTTEIVEQPGTDPAPESTPAPPGEEQ